MYFDKKTNSVIFQKNDPLYKLINLFQSISLTPRSLSRQHSHVLPSRKTFELNSLIPQLEIILNGKSHSLLSFPEMLREGLTLMLQIMNIIVWQIQNDISQKKLFNSQNIDELVQRIELTTLKIDSIDDRRFPGFISLSQIKYNKHNPIKAFNNIYSLTTIGIDNDHAEMTKNINIDLSAQRQDIDVTSRSRQTSSYQLTRTLALSSSSSSMPKLMKSKSVHATRASDFADSVPFFSNSGTKLKQKNGQTPQDIELQNILYDEPTIFAADRPGWTKLKPIISRAQKLVDNGLVTKCIANLLHCYAHPPFFSFKRRRYSRLAIDIAKYLNNNPGLSRHECIDYITARTNSMPMNAYGTLGNLIEKIKEDCAQEPAGILHHLTSISRG